jgi:catechol 2,3-dioxygenase-like lactoylglutathione lyase family enzyme
MPVWGRTTVLVHDYDEARRFYCEGLGFETVFDSDQGGQRYVHLGTNGTGSIWLLRASGDTSARVGRQTNGEPLGVIYVDSLKVALARLLAIGTEPTSVGSDASATFAHVPDLYGNDLVLVEMTTALNTDVGAQV